MKNYFITENTTSIDVVSKSFEFLVPNSSVNVRAQSGKFRSFGDGIISDNFYVGNNLTEHLLDIEVQNSSSCIFTLPKVGNYSTRISYKSYYDHNPECGGIVLPVDNIVYKANTDVVDDLIIIVIMEELKPILEKNYNFGSFDKSYLKLDLKNEKVFAVRSFIESTLHTARNFPHLRESLLVKNNVKEIAMLLLADLIADSLGISSVKYHSSDIVLVKKAEEYIDNECVNIFTIQEIADYLFTSPRTLQKAFKKHREYTPMQFLKDRKLARAHKLLINQTTSHITVKQAAISAGIFDLNRFSKYYKEMFGELPSTTIKNGTNS